VAHDPRQLGRGVVELRVADETCFAGRKQLFDCFESIRALMSCEETDSRCRLRPDFFKLGF
jgi:hypothetical protein